MDNPAYLFGVGLTNYCVSEDEADAILDNYDHGLGLDCILGTPDDDDNDVGDDECMLDFMWDEAICSCVDPDNPECPTGETAIQLSYGTPGTFTCID